MIKRIAAYFRRAESDGGTAPEKPTRAKGLVSWIWPKLKVCLFNRYVAFFLFMLALAGALSKISGLSGLRGHLRIELPILLALYWLFNRLLRPGKLTAAVAALPIAISYVAYDVFFVAWGNVFKVIDFQSLPELLKVLPLRLELILLTGLGLPIVLLLWFTNYKAYSRVLGIVALVGGMVVTMERWPDATLNLLDRAGFQVAEWSDAESVNENGRLTTMLYFEARRRKAIAETATYRERKDYDAQISATADFIRKHGNRRNVHLVVLESFVDPTLFGAVAFSKDPRHPDFADLVRDRQSFSISPVFGGETAQAEFEALCGVPALQRLSEIEFDEFTGDAAGCMPEILSLAGYSTSVSDSFEPNYFNSTKAYTGIGFQKIYFPAEYGSANTTYLTAKNVSDEEHYMFDGDLFEQNLSFVAKTLQERRGQPILNYVLGMYGHEPHEMDPNLRPLVFEVKSGQRDEQLLRAANQYWYRTQAIAHYVRALIKLDPKSLIIIVSDHLPPLEKGVKSYAEYKYLNNVGDSAHMNRIVVVINGKVVRQKTIHHYEIANVIYDYLTTKSFCAENKCIQDKAALEEKYMSLMARAVGHQ